jgi:hypothetical protein
MVNPPNRYEWIQTAPNRYERELDYLEKYVIEWSRSGAKYGQAELFEQAVVTYESERGTIAMIDAFRKAWVGIRQTTPSFAAHMINGKSVYIVDDKEDWLRDTFLISDSTPEKIYSYGEQFKRPVLYVFPHTNQVMLRSPHEYMDGIGAMLFMDVLFRYLDSPPEMSTDEFKRLSPPFFASVTKNAQSEPSQSRVQEQIRTMKLPTVGLPVKNKASLPGPYACKLFKFSQEETVAILAAAKSKAMTVTDAFHAALIRTTYLLSQADPLSQHSSENDHYVGFLPVNLRALCGKYALDFATLKVGAQYVSIPCKGSFSSIVQALQPHYRRIMPTSISLDEVQSECEAVTAHLAEDLNDKASAPSLASLGVVDKVLKERYGDVRISEWRLMICTTSPRLRSSLYTWRKVLMWNVNWNSTYYQQADVESVFESVRRELLLGLEIV